MRQNKFDEVAELYAKSQMPIPEAYLELMRDRFRLRRQDTIIDLGCGSGLLTFPLSKFSARVQGLDSSEKMLRIARESDPKHRIEWICSPVERFDFGVSKYKLIISYESFHLFRSQAALIEKCSSALQPGGHFCVGWCNYHWEPILRTAIKETFISFGVNWGKWGYQAVTNLGDMVGRRGEGLSAVANESIGVHTRTSVSQICAYLATIDKAARLSMQERAKLQDALSAKFASIMPAGHTSGITEYFLAYCRKVDSV